jgi:multidrug resistance efflux pump
MAGGTTTQGTPVPSTSVSDRVRSLRLQDRPKKNASGRSWYPWLLCLVLVGLCGYFGYMAYGRPNDAPDKDSVQSMPADLPRSTSGSSEANIASSGATVVERKGYIIPAHQILVSPKVGGMILKLYIEEGMRVKKDDVLAELETTDYQADYDHSVAVANSAWQKFVELYIGNRPEEIRQAKAELEEMEANRKQLYLDYLRSRRLSGTALADRDYEQAESLYRAMERRVEKLRFAYNLMVEGSRIERIEGAWADYRLAEADVVKAKWRLDNCIVRAPVSGTILTKEAEVGNLVNSLNFNGSYSLCKMADLSDMEVDLSIEEREVAKIFKGQKCKVRPEAYPDRVYEGYVSRLMPTADRAKSAVPVRVKLSVPKEEEGVYLKPDMGAIVSFLKKSEK